MSLGMEEEGKERDRDGGKKRKEGASEQMKGGVGRKKRERMPLRRKEE